MSGRFLGQLLLLIIMLNHAVMACDTLVVHMPDHNHSFISLTDNHSLPELMRHAAVPGFEPVPGSVDAQSNEHLNEQHSEHAHVTCYISFLYGIELLNFTNSVIASSTPALNLISYSPPVPPPNA
ncbi:cobalt transporter [Arsukibacterium sp.]|uniref:cobalt transporter n=1 Tax=Arsukibacterium sp. TaxID=1977258 RepID=UPI00299F1F5E|nr:cobalt transporter [Arsukibacterium sp.]MDX1678329.1 cobalt transporter [Arsukibacterium sp.]